MAANFIMVPGSVAAVVSASGEIRAPKAYLFSGVATDLPAGEHGDIAICFDGTDKGKTFFYSEDATAWVEQ